MKHYFLVILAVLLAVPGSLLARPVAIDMSEPTPVNASVRSLILPGWGQYFNGDTKKMYIIGGGAIVAAVASYLMYARADNTYNDYEKRGIKEDSLYSDYKSQSNQAATVSYIAAGIWVYGIVDAWVSAEKNSESEAIEESRYLNDGFRMASRGNDISVVFRKTF